MEELKLLIKNELGFLPKGVGLDRLLARGEWLELPGRHVLTETGQKAPDVYVIKSGILRFSDMNGDKERTFAFALPGSILMNKHSFVMGLPSYYQVEACCPSLVLRIREQDFWEVVQADLDLAVYMLHYAYGELFYQEYKNSNTHNGRASERFEAMLSDRPSIIEKVPQRHIASYLGITPEYYSQLKKRFLRR